MSTHAGRAFFQAKFAGLEEAGFASRLEPTWRTVKPKRGYHVSPGE